MRLSFVMQTPLEYGEGAQRGSREARAFGFTPVFSMTFVCKGGNTVSNVSTQRTFKCAGHIRYDDRMQTGVPCWKITPHSDATCVFSFPLLSLTPGAWVSPPPHTHTHANQSNPQADYAGNTSLCPPVPFSPDTVHLNRASDSAG